MNSPSSKRAALRFISSFLSLTFLVSLFPPSLLAQSSQDDVQTFYFVEDHLGSVNLVLDEAGNVVERRDYLTCGGERVSESSEPTTDTEADFTGQKLDEETGLHYYNARYYDSILGRFTSLDPWSGSLLDPQTLNKFTYVNNNPVRYIDPDGKELKDFWINEPSNGSSYNYGEEFGVYKGTSITSGGHLTATNSNSYQCTNLAKNFSEDQNSINLDYTGHGYAYGQQSRLDNSVESNNPNASGMYIVYSNGGMVMPQEDDIISWSGGDYGHVGVIAEVVFDEELGRGTVYTLEQNYNRNQALFSQEIERSYDENGNAFYTLSGRGGYSAEGWARYGNQSIEQSEFTSTQHTPATGEPMSYQDTD